MPIAAHTHPDRRPCRWQRRLVAIVPLLFVVVVLPDWTEHAASMLAGRAGNGGPVTRLSSDHPPAERRPPGRRRTRDPGRLRPVVEAAFIQASTDAAAEGIELTMTSGYRSPEHQQALFEEALQTYGEQEALRWVLPPERSMHVRGIAIDAGPRSGAEWLAVNGARYGLCRTYSWEWWHFEYRPALVIDGVCPPAAD